MTPRRALRLAVPAVLIVAAVIAIRLFGDGSTVARDGLNYAAGDLAAALDAGGDQAGVRTLERFTDRDGVACSAFLASDLSGVACRERGGWHLRIIRGGVSLGDPAAVGRTEAALRASATAMAAQ